MNEMDYERGGVRRGAALGSLCRKRQRRSAAGLRAEERNGMSDGALIR